MGQKASSAMSPASPPVGANIADTGLGNDPKTVPHRRVIGWIGTSALAMGGSNQSIFLISALIAGQGNIPGQGSATIPLLIIGLILSLAAAPGWLELVLMYPNRVGGIAACCTAAFKPYGEILSVLTGICYWWGWVPTCGLTALFSAAAIQQWLLPWLPVNVIAIGIVIAFFLINLLGIRPTTRVAIGIAIASSLLAFLSALVPIAFGQVDWHRATTYHLNVPFNGWFGQLTSLMAGLYLIGFGAPAFEAATCHVGETVDHEHNLPRSMLANALMAVLYFAVLPVVWLGVIGEGALGGDLSRVLGPTFSPLFGTLGPALGLGFVMFNMFHGTVQPLAGAARTLSQLAEDGLVPSILARRLSTTDTPWVASAVTAVCAIWFLLIGDPIWLVAAANFTYLIGIALPNVAVWLLRRDAADAPRPWRAPPGTVGLGLIAAAVWAASTLLGFEQFGLPTVVFGLAMAYSGAAVFGLRILEDRWRAGLQGIGGTLHFKLTGAMLLVLVLDAIGYIEAVARIPSQNTWLVVALEDIFVAVAMLTISVGIILPGMIGHSATEIRNAAERLTHGPLTDFTRAIRALGRGELDYAVARVLVFPVLVKSHDELGSMASSFNTMQENIAAAAAGLEQARASLLSARDEVERASHAKSAFLATMTHEIRTPLNAIVGIAGMLADTSLDSEQSKSIAYLKEACDSLVSIVNDVLDFSKIEAGKLELIVEPFDLGAIVKSSALILDSQAKSKGLTIFVSIDAKVHNWVLGDSVRLRQVLLNLISNAVKFTEQGAVKIKVTADRNDAARLTFSIVDTGIGITDEHKESLFKSFSQIQRPRVQRNTGTGLGLAISKFIVEAMPEGRIGVESTPGLGSTFWFSARFDPAPSEPASEVSPLGPTARGEFSDGGQVKVLVVDDVDLNQVVIKMMLEREGFAVKVVNNGKEALGAINREPFSIILMDIEMPVMDGLTCARAIRALDQRVSRTPIIALTANAFADEVDACRMAGMDDYLAKPVDRVRLAKVIRYWVAHRNMLGADAPPASMAPAIVDPGKQAELQQYFSSEKIIEFVGRLRDEMSVVMRELDATTEDSLVRRQLHELFSSAAALGYVEVSTRCSAVLDVIRLKGNPDDREAAIRDLRDALTRAIEHLAAFEKPGVLDVLP